MVSAWPNRYGRYQHGAPARHCCHTGYAKNAVYDWHPVGEPCVTPCDRYPRQQQRQYRGGQPTDTAFPYHLHHQHQNRRDGRVMPKPTRLRPCYINNGYFPY